MTEQTGAPPAPTPKPKASPKRRRLYLALGLGTLVILAVIVVLVTRPSSGTAGRPSWLGWVPEPDIPGQQKTGQLAEYPLDFSNLKVPQREIQVPGWTVNEVPALGMVTGARPAFASGEGVSKVVGSENRVLGVVVDGHARAYPLKLLVRHVTVNDLIGKSPILVIWDPLADAQFAFRRPEIRPAEVAPKPPAAPAAETAAPEAPPPAEQPPSPAPPKSLVRLTFGNSGLLYNDSFLLFDEQSRSLWCPMLAEAVSGRVAGKKLEAIPAVLTTWSQWQKAHPDSDVLAGAAGGGQDYSQDSYASVLMQLPDGTWSQGNYWETEGIMYPIPNPAKRNHGPLPSKARVIGVAAGGEYKAYPFAVLEKAKSVHDTVGGVPLTIEFYGSREGAQVFSGGRPYPQAHAAFWFVWHAFFPQSQLYRAGPTP